MARLPAAVHDAFSRQHGAISIGQLRAADLTDRQIRRLVDDGAITNCVRGAYVSPSTADTELRRCAAVCLARPDVIVGGPTAGRLWDLRHVHGDRRVHVIGPPASNPSIASWVVPYRTAAIHLDRDVVERSDAIRVTTAARTVFDLARHLEHDRLLSVIEQVIASHGATVGDLYDVAAEWCTPRRRFAHRFLSEVERRLPGGGAESHPEVLVGQRLRELGVRHLERQVTATLSNGRVVRFDLAVRRLRWAVEVDVHPTHRATDGVRSDEDRDDAAEADGWSVSRISSADYHHRFETSMRTLAAVARRLESTTDERNDPTRAVRLPTPSPTTHR